MLTANPLGLAEIYGQGEPLVLIHGGRTTIAACASQLTASSFKTGSVVGDYDAYMASLCGGGS